jgi:protein tyrosine kinase modulator
VDNASVQTGFDLKQFKSAFQRRKKSFWISFGITAVLSVLMVVLIPATYLSKSTILIEQQEIPQELVRSTVTSYADQRIEVITQRVMTSANLWKIVEKYDLYKDDLKRETREYVIDMMRNDHIKRNVISAEVVDPRSGRPTQATIAFQLSFEYENPAMAQKVTNELTSLFLSENLKSRTQMAEQASTFFENEASRLNLRVNELEQALAVFKEENFESLPELTRLNLNLLDRTEQSLNDNKREMSLVSERISFLESELAQIDPDMPFLRSNGQQYLSSVARLKQAKQQLEQQSARYSAIHPTVQRLEKEISVLVVEVGDREAPKLKLEIYQRQLAQLERKYTNEHPEVLSLRSQIERLKVLASDPSATAMSEHADNPAYLQIRGQLETAQIQLSGLKGREISLREELKKYEARIAQSPRIEQSYQQLTRDYQTSVLKYAEIKAKQEEANLGQSLESKQKGERFTLIEPPLVPEEAHSPNRKLLAVLGVLLTIGISVAIVFVKEVLDQSIKSRKELVSAVGAPPLAVIPYIPTQQEVLSRKQYQLYLIVGCVIAACLVIGVFHMFVKPLDVTWFIVMRKMGWM